MKTYAEDPQAKLEALMALDAGLDQAAVEAILARYDCGLVQAITPLTAGTVQTNVLVRTSAGQFVLRVYKEQRTFASVRFEVNLINYLKRRHYPCPAVLRDQQGHYLGVFHERPYALFAWLEGVHIVQPDAAQQRQLIHKVAELQLLTRHYRPRYLKARWNYDRAFCERMATKTAASMATPNAQAKLAWYRQTLAQLVLPAAHPKGICHCDFHFSNVLFKEGIFHALLDFDDANYTYLTFDLVALIEPYLFRFQWDSWPAVPPGDACFDFTEARQILAIYETVRPLSALEKHYLFDVLKLATLIDCLWYFARGELPDFYEKHKIDCLDGLGRARFCRELFG